MRSMKFLLFELYFFALWSILGFGVLGLDAFTITTPNNGNLYKLMYTENEKNQFKSKVPAADLPVATIELIQNKLPENRGNRVNHFQVKPVMNTDDSENDDSGLTYGSEEFDGDTRLLPSFNTKRSSRINVFSRSCIHRNGACDHRPNDCCYSSSCRCNLWGSNCRCQRVGLFQKWG